MEKNSAQQIKNPKVTNPPTMPFTREEMMEILAACSRLPDNYGKIGSPNGRRARDRSVAAL